jgi:hypothetical protein
MQEFLSNAHGAMFSWSWNKTRRRRQLLQGTIPEEWRCYLQENVRHFARLPALLQQRLQDKVRIFVGERTWVECGGLVIDDEVRVTIAAQACLLLLGHDDDFCFDQVRSVLVYPGTYLRRESRYNQWASPETETPTLGEAWHHGPIVLSWAHALAGGHDADNGRNVVFHEFAHHLDELDGAMDGTPPLASREEHCRWSRVTQREFQRLSEAARRNQATLLSHYGATSQVEFFAVATECFFMRPQRMRREHEELYEVLRQFYRLDPAAWYEEPQWTDPAKTGNEVAPADDEAYQRGVARTLREWRLPAGSADAAFAEGMIHSQHGQFSRALACFSETLRRDPADAEAHWQRGLTYMEVNDIQMALDDFSQAIRLAPTEADYYLARSRAYDRLGRTVEACADWDAAVRWDPTVARASR